MNTMEHKYNDHFQAVFDALRRLISADAAEKESIGFKVEEEVGIYQ